MKKEFERVVDEWLDQGGVVYLHTDVVFPHEEHLCTTSDEGVMHDLYQCRSEEFADMGEDEYLRELCRISLERFLSKEKVEELMNW